MRMVVTGLALLIFNFFSIAPAPPALSPRASHFLASIARVLNGAVIVCPGRQDIDPMWRCIYTRLGAERVKAVLSQPRGGAPRQTGPWDDDTTARFTFGGSSLASASLLSGAKQRLLVWHETNP